MPDPIEELREKFRDSIVDRGMTRYERNAVDGSGEVWTVEGDDTLKDSRSQYTVTFSTERGKYHCDCYDTQYGQSRENKVCSHSLAVMIYRRMERVKDDLDLGEDEGPENACERLLDEVWPHPDYRDGQKEVMVDCLETLFEEGKDTYILCAPTGFGKSPVGYTLAYAAGLMTRCNGSFSEKCERARERAQNPPAPESVGYYVTPQNILLNQLDADYGGLDTFGMVKGRSHYSCSECTSSCSDGPCRFDDDMYCTSYAPARDEAIESAVTNTNFSMFMVHPQIQRRGALVVDEAHMMPEYVLGHVEVQLREDRLAEEDLELPKFEEFEDYVDWANRAALKIGATLEQLSMDLQLQAESGSAPDRDAVKKYERLERLKGKLERLVDDWQSVEEPWVVDYDDSFYDEWKEEYVDKVTFRPITPYRFMDDLVFEKGEKTIISSATPPKAEQLGLEPEEVKVEEVESSFPVDNRPCYIDPVGKMSSSTRSNNLDDLLDFVETVSVGNTLIHAHTYKFAQEIHEGLSERVGEAAVDLQDGDRREGSLNDWKNSEAKFFVSVNMYDGVDLKDDICRTNIVCVCPFPYLGDPQVQKRKEEEGDEFFNWQTAMRIQQAYGRSTRSEEDWSNTYIVDSNFGWFFDRHEEECFFDWFKEAIEYA